MKIFVHKNTKNILNSSLFYKGSDDIDFSGLENSKICDVYEVSDSYLHSLDLDYKVNKIFRYIDNEIVVEEEFNSTQTKNRINYLKSKLTDTDYKIIKAYEAQLVDGAVTYDFEQVHAERQKMRDEINELETILAQHTDDKE